MSDKGHFRVPAGSMLVIFCLVAFDQWTKYLAVTRLKGQEDFMVIKGILSFTYLQNKGAAWGMLSGQILFFIIITLLLSAGILYLYKNTYRLKENRYRNIILRADLLVLLSGAIGNFIDRVMEGYVVDFIQTEFMEFPVFNVADCYVTISIGVFAILSLFFINEEEMDVLFRPMKKTEK